MTVTSSRLLGHGACNKCGSKDAVALYDDDKPNKCMSCDHLHHVKEQQQEVIEEMEMKINDLPYGTTSDRGIGQSVAELFGVRRAVSSDGGTDAVYYLSLIHI